MSCLNAVGLNYTDLLVARHGETEWNSNGRWQGNSDIPLNPNGMDQAKELANKLVNEDIRHIYSSDLSRAHMTAEIVRKRTGSLGVHIDRRLRERNLGKFEGWTVPQVAKYLKIPDERATELEYDELMIDGIPTVEAWEDFRKRVWASLIEIAGRHTGSKCLVVAHGGVMRAITMNIEEGSAPQLDFGNTEFIRLRFEGDKASLVSD